MLGRWAASAQSWAAGAQRYAVRECPEAVLMFITIAPISVARQGVELITDFQSHCQ